MGELQPEGLEPVVILRKVVGGDEGDLHVFSDYRGFVRKYPSKAGCFFRSAFLFSCQLCKKFGIKVLMSYTGMSE